MKDTVVILNNIRSSYNVGAIFRTADAAGVSKIYLVGYTPLPFDRFQRPNKEISKTALGAEKTVEWEHYEDISSLFIRIKREGYSIVAVEQYDRSVDYKTVVLPEKAAFLFGNEVGGIPQEVLKQCDIVAEIPMLGMKESLNVSVSAGIVLFRVLGI